MTPRSRAKLHRMHFFCQWCEYVDSWIFVRKNGSLLSLLTFVAQSDSAKRGATIDTPFCTYQNLESPVPMTILSYLSKTTLNSELEKKVWKRPKPKPDQASICFFLRGIRIHGRCVRHLNTLDLNTRASRRRTPL
jgi:hypothetical protein